MDVVHMDEVLLGVVLLDDVQQDDAQQPVDLVQLVYVSRGGWYWLDILAEHYEQTQHGVHRQVHYLDYSNGARS